MKNGGITWEKVPNSSEGLYAMRNGNCIGHICHRASGEWVYSIHNVHCKWITKGYGEVGSKAQAKKSLVRAWTEWLKAFQLEPKKETVND